MKAWTRIVIAMTMGMMMGGNVANAGFIRVQSHSAWIIHMSNSKTQEKFSKTSKKISEFCYSLQRYAIRGSNGFSTEFRREAVRWRGFVLMVGTAN